MFHCAVCHQYRAVGTMAPMRSIVASVDESLKLPWNDVIIDCQGPLLPCKYRARRRPRWGFTTEGPGQPRERRRRERSGTGQKGDGGDPSGASAMEETRPLPKGSGQQRAARWEGARGARGDGQGRQGRRKQPHGGDDRVHVGALGQAVSERAHHSTRGPRGGGSAPERMQVREVHQRFIATKWISERSPPVQHLRWRGDSR